MNPFFEIIEKGTNSSGRRPVWLMRQAGRVLPDYIKIREKFSSFSEMLRHPEVICQVTLLPLKYLNVDAVIVFKDLYTICEGLGIEYELVDGGIIVKNSISPYSKTNFPPDDIFVEKLSFLTSGINLIKKEIKEKKVIIGFTPSPLTLYAGITKSGTGGFEQSLYYYYNYPIFFKKITNNLIDSIISYMKIQLSSGCDLIQVFDSYGYIFPVEVSRNLTIEFLNRLKGNSIDRIIYFSPYNHALYYEDVFNEIWGISLDEKTQPDTIENHLSEKIILQGNLDPLILTLDKKVIKEHTIKMLRRFPSKRHIVNTGGGLRPDTPLKNIQFFIDLCKEYDRAPDSGA